MEKTKFLQILKLVLVFAKRLSSCSYYKDMLFGNIYNMDNIWWLLIVSTISVVYLFIISKLLGKKQIAQLEFIDYVIGISIGSIAAEMATDLTETPFYHYLIAMSIFFIFDVLITLGAKRNSF